MVLVTGPVHDAHETPACLALPQAIDTGIDVITQENVDTFLADAV